MREGMSEQERVLREKMEEMRARDIRKNGKKEGETGRTGERAGEKGGERKRRWRLEEG